MTDYAARAHRGAALLDRRLPGWATKINLSNFGTGSSDTCVLGQLFGPFILASSLVPIHLDLRIYTSDMSYSQRTAAVAAYGFGLYRPEHPNDWDTAWNALDAAWRHEIKSRL